MKEELISFETAKLAKEKGFDIPTYTAYIGDKFHKNEDEPNGYDGYDLASKENWNKKDLVFTKNGGGCFGCQNNPKYFEAYTVTTQSLLQRWLREVHEIKLCIHYTCIDDSEYAYIWDITTNCEKGRKKDSWDFNEKKDSFSIMSWWDTYEQALEAGLLKALKMINNEKEQ